MSNRGFPNDSVGKQSTCDAGDTADVGGLSLIPGSGISPGGGNGNPLLYSCLEKSHGQRSLAGCKASDMTEHINSCMNNRE